MVAHLLKSLTYLTASARPNDHLPLPCGSRSLSDSGSARKPDRSPCNYRYKRVASATPIRHIPEGRRSVQPRRPRKIPSPLRSCRSRPLRRTLPRQADSTVRNPNRSKISQVPGTGHNRLPWRQKCARLREFPQANRLPARLSRLLSEDQPGGVLDRKTLSHPERVQPRTCPRGPPDL